MAEGQFARRAWAALFVACLLAVTVGCGTHGASASGSPDGFFAALSGDRTSNGALVIDEKAGAFAGVELGMPFAQAKKLLPSTYYFAALTPGTDAIYCSRAPSRDTCTGVSLHVFAGCPGRGKFCLPGKAGPVARIDITATTRPASIPGSREMVTLKGVRLGMSAAEIGKRYTVASRRGTACSDDVAGQASVFVVVEGRNTLIFQAADGVIWSITLLAGRHPSFCG